MSNPHFYLMYSTGCRTVTSAHRSRCFAKRPELGECREDNGGTTPQRLHDNVIITRKTITDLQNQGLAENGHDARVDHRSLREQGKQRRPERHLGSARIRRLSADEKAEYAAHRASRETAAVWRYSVVALCLRHAILAILSQNRVESSNTPSEKNSPGALAGAEEAGPYAPTLARNSFIKRTYVFLSLGSEARKTWTPPWAVR